jgi:type I restriction enzyme, S subunit
MEYLFCKIENVCDITSSKRIFKDEYKSDGIPFFRAKEISEKHKGEKTVSDKIYISRDKYESIKKRHGAPVDGDLLLTSIGALLGEPYVVHNDGDFYFKDGNLTWFRDFQGLDSKYLYYWLISPDGKTQLKKAIIGSAQPAFTISALKKMDIRLPSLAYQRKVTAILSTYDNLIENNSRRIKILEEMARMTYREWFVNFRFPGHEKVKMVDSPLGTIPEGWEVKAVQDTFEILGGGTPSTKEPAYWVGGTVNWYSPTDLTSKGTMFMDESATKITELGLQKSSARLFPAFSVMMTSRATLGVIAINTTEASTNQGFITCIPNERFPLHALYFWLSENIGQFISLASGATFKEITKGVFKTIELAAPPAEIVCKFEELVSTIGKQLLNLQRKNHNLRQTRDLLLPKLISGEVLV